jgi:hypothetical protein
LAKPYYEEYKFFQILRQTLYIKPLYLTNLYFLYQVYNNHMSPRHFSRMMNPKMAKQEDESLANAFTSFTVAIGLGRYFSPSPAAQMINSPIEDPAKAGDQKIDHSSFYK